ncbi:MAG: bifunctional glutamine synthetase adenylyltransferase/deadenyltransferase, partial [Gallionellaceae bacterium]|nr:bifunctional glutamine synthetase adenylyltransferase/deadenyltransferase [Gallionellaceae bacterium]
MNTAIPLDPADFDTAVQRTLRGSRYVQRLLDHDPELLPWLRTCYATPCTAAEMAAWLSLLPLTDEASLSRALRILRKRVMLKLLTRDLGGWADLVEVTACMTALAEITIQHA